MKRCINLDFGTYQLKADLYDTPIADQFIKILPVEIMLEYWGEEAYGCIKVDLGKENPLSDIPKGGIAYSQKGNHLCLFFGQSPAWPVDLIGKIQDDQWKRLKNYPKPDSVKISLEHTQ